MTPRSLSGNSTSCKWTEPRGGLTGKEGENILKWCKGGGNSDWREEQAEKASRSHLPHYYATKTETVSGSPWLHCKEKSLDLNMIQYISFTHSLNLSLGLMSVPDGEQNMGPLLIQLMCWEGYIWNTVSNIADSNACREENKAEWWVDTGRDGDGWVIRYLTRTLKEDLLEKVVVRGQW